MLPRTQDGLCLGVDNECGDFQPCLQNAATGLLAGGSVNVALA